MLHTTLLHAAALVTYATVQLYPTAGVITAADQDVAQVTTVSGHVYELTNTGADWFPGDAVALIMTDNATPECTDDTPVMAHYIGGRDALYHLGQ